MNKEKINNKNLMLNKEEIMKAVEESQEIKKKYPSFWKFYQLLLVLNDSMFDLEDFNKNKKK